MFGRKKQDDNNDILYQINEEWYGYLIEQVKLNGLLKAREINDPDKRKAVIDKTNDLVNRLGDYEDDFLTITPEDCEQLIDVLLENSHIFYLSAGMDE